MVDYNEKVFQQLNPLKDSQQHCVLKVTIFKKRRIEICFKASAAVFDDSNSDLSENSDRNEGEIQCI